MGLPDKLRKFKNNNNLTMDIELRKRNCNQNLVVPTSQVTEQSLEVWRTLPPQIRHDPSMASFQIENERLHGSSAPTDDDSTTIPNDLVSSHADDNSNNGLDFTNTDLKEQPLNNNNNHHHHYLHINQQNNKIDKKSAEDEGLPSDNDLQQFRGSIKENEDEGNKKYLKEKRKRIQLTKRIGLIIFWIFAALTFMIFEEKHLSEKTLAVPRNIGKDFPLLQKPTGDFKLKIFATFNDTFYQDNETETLLTIQPQLLIYNKINETWDLKNILDPWHLALVNEDLFDEAPIVGRNFTFHMTNDILEELDGADSKMQLKMYTNVVQDVAIKLIYNPLIIDVKTGTFLAALILMTFYALLVWEVFERTFVAIICSMLSVAVLACFNDRPNMEEIVEWMDMEMLTLLFCMMIIVGILTETGIFDYIAVVAFELSGGKIWPMIYSLCLITCLVSSFLDNMSTVLFMTPVAIRLCEVMSLDPVPVLMGIIVHSNIGGSLTPIGDPISIIICSNHFIAANGVTFLKFVEHTIPGVLLTVVQSCIYLRLMFLDIESLRLNEPKEIKELRREIRVWHRAANSISSFSKDADLVRETLQRKVRMLKHVLKRKLRGLDNTEEYVHTLEDLKLKYPIKNKLLLVQACGALIFVIISFFIQSVPQWRTLPLGWVALLGVIALLIILNREDMDHLMHRIEWTTLLFFAAMFVMMECVERLGLFSWMGKITEHIILYVDERNRLAVAVFIILWISALASAILDSIPVTAMMVKVVVSLVANESLGLPLQPLVWALTFGACLGGNGTLYGASANVISAGIAEQHGYKISFTRYLRIVFPMMLGQIAIISAYLFVSHILFEWH